MRRFLTMIVVFLAAAGTASAELKQIKLPGGFYSARALETVGGVKERLYAPFWNPETQPIYPGCEIELCPVVWRGAGKTTEKIEIDLGLQTFKSFTADQIKKGEADTVVIPSSVTDLWEPGTQRSLMVYVYNRDRRDTLGNDLKPLIISVVSRDEFDRLYRPKPTAEPERPAATAPADPDKVRSPRTNQTFEDLEAGNKALADQNEALEKEIGKLNAEIARLKAKPLAKPAIKPVQTEAVAQVNARVEPPAPPIFKVTLDGKEVTDRLILTKERVMFVEAPEATQKVRLFVYDADRNLLTFGGGKKYPIVTDKKQIPIDMTKLHGRGETQIWAFEALDARGEIITRREITLEVK